MRVAQPAAAEPQARPEGSDPTGLLALQHGVGNRTVRQLVEKANGHGSYQLDRAALLRLTQGEGSLVPDSALQTTTQAGPLQRDEEDAAPQDGAVTIEEVGYEYYDVQGSTLAEVAPQLDPVEWGRCRYQYDYSYETTRGRTTRVDVTLRLTIRLPRWQGEGWNRASPAAQREWQRMMQALEGHEDEHADIARRHAPAFKQRLLNQRERRVRPRYNQALGRVDRETRRFDRRTRHGRSQGVTLDTSIR